LTTDGKEPESVSPTDEPRLTCLSYPELARLIFGKIQEGVEPSERGRVFAKDFAETLFAAAGRRIEMTESGEAEISEPSQFFFEKYDEIERIRNSAIEETTEFIEWMFRYINSRLREEYDAEIEMSTIRDWARTWHKPEWRMDGNEFGVSFSAEPKFGKEMLPGLRPGIGIRVLENDNEASQRKVSDAISAFLQDDYEPDVFGEEMESFRDAFNRNLSRGSDWWPAWFRSEIEFEPEEKTPREWAETTIYPAIAEMWRGLAPAFDEFVRTQDR
jgi:hypothetical protein